MLPVTWLLLALAADGVRSSHEGAAADIAAMHRMANGDGAALAELYDRHGRAIFSLAFRILREQADAEEVVQDVFAQAWRHAARYDTSRGAVVAWLLILTRSRAIDRLRTRRGQPVSQEEHPSAVEALAAAAAPADLELHSADQARRVRAALDALPFLQKAAIELAYFEGLTHAEVAERLQQPLGTVKTRIRAGLLRLRTAFDGERA